MPETNRQIVLKRRPNGMPVPEDFAIVDSPMPEPGEGQVLLRGIYLSLDPYMRGRISGQRSYAKPTGLGEVIEGRVVGQVARSRHPDFREGDYAFGGYGWQTHSAVDGVGLTKLDPDAAPISTSLGILGMPGLTAYVGLKTIGAPKPGETVVISAASGAVGAVAGQLAKRDGCHVVGIAGGADKCRYVTDELGFDACLDHRGDLGAALDAACPNGIDVYFENVGGAVQRAVYPRLNDFGRMIMCGMIAEYNDVEPRPGRAWSRRCASGSRSRVLSLAIMPRCDRNIWRWRRPWCARARSNFARISSMASLTRPPLLSVCCRGAILAS